MVAVGLLLVGSVGVFEATKQASPSAAVPEPPPSEESEKIGVPMDPRLIKLSDGLVGMRDAFTIAESLHQKDNSTQSDLESIGQLLELYRFVFKANPVGSENEEILGVLMGKNPKQLVFFPREHPNLTEHGALKDRWGTAYHFHPISAQLMDVRSAGPDQKLWTADDQSLGLHDEAEKLKLTR